jgi:hypothetical protein
MKAFGFELRKVGDVKGLYEDVDKVLAGVPIGGINTEIQIQTVAHTLHKMLQPDKWLDICGIKDCARLCGICISEERMLVYSSAHCMNWNQMTPEFRVILSAMILDDFRVVLNS